MGICFNSITKKEVYPMLSVNDVSKKLKVSDQHIRKLLREGLIKAETVGKQWIIDEAAVEEYIKNNNIAIEPSDYPRGSSDIPEFIALSFFSGSMGLDIGLSKGGIEPILACETDKYCRMTINKNKPDTALIGDIEDYSADKILEFARLPKNHHVDLVVGGPPCQAFSSAGTRKGLEDARGNVFLTFIDRILEIKPKYAVIENVRGLLSSKFPYSDQLTIDECLAAGIEPIKGGALLHIISRLRKGGYTVSFELYNSANFGAPQSRERIVIIAYKGKEKVGYLIPTHSKCGEHGLKAWNNLSKAFEVLPEDIVHHHINFPEKRLKYYRLLSEGQNWRNLPIEMQKEALGKSYYLGGGKTGFFRRLAYNKPSPTLVTNPTMPATDLCHPNENRPLSVEEYKVIQGFPLNWQICGSLIEQYKQIGNAVPIKLGEAIAKNILLHKAGTQKNPPVGFKFSRYKNTDDASWERTIRNELNNSRQLSLIINT